MISIWLSYADRKAREFDYGEWQQREELLGGKLRLEPLQKLKLI
jgi:hypothetical protein